MTYTCLDDICDLALSFKTETERKLCSSLLKVYWDAYENPPKGVVGVGAVTYAENALIEYQHPRG